MEFLPKKVRTSTLKEFKASGHKFSCLTSYDHLTAGLFDQSGIDVLLVGDSAADNSLGYSSTLPITVAEMATFGRAVASAALRALVVIDMPFGSYETGPADALANAIALMKPTGADAVKLEGGKRSADQIRTLVEAGIPVMGHIGFTPQSVNVLGGFKIQGRGDAAEQLLEDALAVQNAGAFAVVLEMVPSAIAGEISAKLDIPTIGIGAGPQVDGQILVWTDFAGMTAGRPRKFVKRYANLGEQLASAALNYRTEVANGQFPTADHSFED
ncbi:3-methyl-2-oxobutanoate hydroxymethyltransferase [Rhodoluna sp. KAS3]|uniref:3-methyl-2-oxobutanoate hydroxymethyltransferase n=1 Tax=Rhodoluna sp. KAS3 TaxID=942880 RepID=UPI0022326CEC|nr:3-methyl-2-oxobutanoate hydroxymethyltransferase [Rhodoluna sp. KAS3]BDS49111.1 3-methyl-2-oxobutanoate hydroxymethyltransferase [Rhodoluna sp. KAS3]